MTDYKANLLTDLKDLEYSAYYLSAAMADSPEVFFLALRDVVEAQKGMAKVATHSLEGNPRLSSLGSVLRAMGLGLVIESGHGVSRAAVKAPTSRATRSPAPKVTPSRNPNRAGQQHAQ